MFLEQAVEFLVNIVVESVLFHLLGAAVIGGAAVRWFLGKDISEKIEKNLEDKYGDQIQELKNRLDESRQIIDKIPPPETKT